MRGAGAERADNIHMLFGWISLMLCKMIFRILCVQRKAHAVPCDLGEHGGCGNGGGASVSADNGDTGDRHDGEHDRDREHDHEDAWKSRITPLSAMNYAVIGGLGVLWAVLALCYWLAVIAWLYKSAVNVGMNKSLWAVLGLFFNIFAVMAFCIVRDRPVKN